MNEVSQASINLDHKDRVNTTICLEFTATLGTDCALTIS